jgi:hypothetical protein
VKDESAISGVLLCAGVQKQGFVTEAVRLSQGMEQAGELKTQSERTQSDEQHSNERAGGEVSGGEGEGEGGGSGGSSRWWWLNRKDGGW